MKVPIYLLVLMCHASYSKRICGKVKENVQYTVYNQIADVIVYQCENTSIACDKSVPENDIVKYCITQKYAPQAFASPDCYRNESGQLSKVKLIKTIAQVNLREDSILIDGVVGRYSTGKYSKKIGTENVTKVWKPELDLCDERGVVYNGPADVWTLNAHRYIQGRISRSRFTLELLEEKDTCEKKWWTTNHYGFYVSESKNSTTVIEDDIHLVGNEDLELVCYLTMSLAEQEDREAELRRNIYYIALVAAVFILWFIITFIFRVSTNCLALKRKKKMGCHLFRALSTTLTIHYLRQDESVTVDDSESVHDYESVDYISNNKIGRK